MNLFAPLTINLFLLRQKQRRTVNIHQILKNQILVKPSLNRTQRFNPILLEFNDLIKHTNHPWHKRILRLHWLRSQKVVGNVKNHLNTTVTLIQTQKIKLQRIKQSVSKCQRFNIVISKTYSVRKFLVKERNHLPQLYYLTEKSQQSAVELFTRL